MAIGADIYWVTAVLDFVGLVSALSQESLSANEKAKASLKLAVNLKLEKPSGHSHFLMHVMRLFTPNEDGQDLRLTVTSAGMGAEKLTRSLQASSAIKTKEREQCNYMSAIIRFSITRHSVYNKCINMAMTKT